MNARLSLAIGVLLLAGCHPRIDHVRPGDLSAGYDKFLDVSVKPRLARRIILTGQLTSNAVTYEVHSALGPVLAFPGTRTLDPDGKVTYRVVVTYSWPFSTKRRERIMEGSLVVGDPGHLTGLPQSLCFVVGEQTTSSWQFNPKPQIDPVPVTVGALEFARASPPSGSPQAAVLIDLLGVGAGRENLELVTDRKHLVVSRQALVVVPDATGPIDLESGSPSGDEVVPEPPEVDGWVGQPHALRWLTKRGAIEYAVEIYRDGETLVDSFLVAGERTYAVTWLSHPGQYSWRLRARVPTCASEPIWTQFSELHAVR